jgi:hypothetical protein
MIKHVGLVANVVVACGLAAGGCSYRETTRVATPPATTSTVYAQPAPTTTTVYSDTYRPAPATTTVYTNR